jgi:hypothetical protein
MSNLVYGYENWQNVYSTLNSEDKKNVWIYIKFSNGQDVYLQHYANLSEVRNLVQTHNFNIDAIGLRYKSHEIIVDTKDSDAIYIVRSLKGEFGGNTKHCYTTGYLKNNQMHKTMWITPELVEESSYIDELDNCFEEAIIYHGERAKKTNAI